MGGPKMFYNRVGPNDWPYVTVPDIHYMQSVLKCITKDYK